MNYKEVDKETIFKFLGTIYDTELLPQFSKHSFKLIEKFDEVTGEPTLSIFCTQMITKDFFTLGLHGANFDGWYQKEKFNHI